MTVLTVLNSLSLYEFYVFICYTTYMVATVQVKYFKGKKRFMKKL